MRSGYINISNGQLKYANLNGYGWSLLAFSKRNDADAISAYVVYFNATGIYPSNNNYYYRWHGLPLRGLVSGGGNRPSEDLDHSQDKHH